MKKDPITLKLSVLSSDINQEQGFTTCTRNTEISHSTELSVNFIWIWLVITELQETLFQLSEQLSSIKKTTSEDPNLTCSEKMDSNSPSPGPSLELVIEDTDLFSKQQNLEHSDNDLFSLFKIDIFILY